MDNTNLNQQPVQEITKKKKWLLPVILGVAALLVIGIGVGGFIYIKSVALPKKEVQRNLDLGDKYLTDMDYEKAVLSYKEAITIDPKNIKAYVGLGDAYLAWADELAEEGDTEEAIKKLKKGIKELKSGINETGSDEVKEKQEELENKKKEMEGGTDDKEEKKSSKKEEKSETEPVDNEAEKLAREKEVNQEVAKIVVNWDNSEATVFDEYDPKAFEDGQIGAMIIKPYFSSDLISSGELEAGSECTLSDADGNVVAVQKLEQDGGKMTYTCTLYSLDYDFSIEGEPATPFNNSVIDTATADITQAGESDIHYVYEDMYVRSYTGVYFLGICTCENGKIGTWIVPEYMMSSYQNIDEGVWPKNHMK